MQGLLARGPAVGSSFDSRHVCLLRLYLAAANRARATRSVRTPEPQYGIIRRSLALSAASATTLFPSLRFLFFDFDVNMWRANACPRTTLPLPVFLNRLDAPLWV